MKIVCIVKNLERDGGGYQHVDTAYIDEMHEIGVEHRYVPADLWDRYQSADEGPDTHAVQREIDWYWDHPKWQSWEE